MKKLLALLGVLSLFFLTTAQITSGIPRSWLSTSGTLTENSDSRVATQKATKTYVDTKVPGSVAISLQATTPGTAQTGHGNISGTFIAGGFSGPLTGSATLWGAYATIAGPTQARTYTFPDAAATILYDGKASGTFGTASSATGSAVFYNISNANAFTIQPGATGAALSWTFPIAAPGGNNYLVNAQTTGALGYTDPATFALVGQTMNIGTTAVAINRASAALALTGITSIDGSAATCVGNAGSATYAATSTIADDTTTNATVYPLWATAITGNLALKGSSSKLFFNPLSGLLTAINMQAGSYSPGNATGGYLTASGLESASAQANALFSALTAGPIIKRNVADAGPALVVQQVHASSTGDILQLKNNAATVFAVTQGGNALLGLAAGGTSLAKGIAVGTGTAASAVVVGAQLWVSNLNGASTGGWQFMNQAATTVFTMMGCSGIIANNVGAATILDTGATPTVNTGWMSVTIFNGTVVKIPYW